jgi:fatty-acyl-CoA synthase
VTTFAGPPLEPDAGGWLATLPGLLHGAAERHGGREALVFHPGDGPPLRWSYSDLEREACALGRSLMAVGVGKGTRVALLMGNRPEWVAAFFAVAMVGGVVVPLNTFLEPGELGWVLAHCDASVVLAQRRLRHHDYLCQLEDLCPVLPSTRFPHLRRVVMLGLDNASGVVEPWAALAGRAGEVPEEVLRQAAAGVAPSDDAVVICTSGTTSAPKAILHAQRAPVLQSWRFAEQLRIGPGSRVWSPFPFFGAAGICMILGSTLFAGGCLVLQEAFDAGEALRLIEAERVTTPHAWPHQIAELEEHPAWASTDLSSLEQADPASAFGRHPSVHLERPYSPRAAYGLSETFTIVTSMPSDTPDSERGNSHGCLLPGNMLRILSPTSGEALGPGESGEIAVKGATLMKGYLKVEPERCFDTDGFFHTGDAGFMDTEGRLHWTGRADDLIKTGGANVSPVEVEEALLSHPALRAAVVVGVPDQRLGQLVVACVVAHPDQPEDEAVVLEHLRGRLASYKLPRRVLFFSEGELPLTANAKLRTGELRALAAARLGSS